MIGVWTGRPPRQRHARAEILLRLIGKLAQVIGKLARVIGKLAQDRLALIKQTEHFVRLGVDARQVFQRLVARQHRKESCHELQRVEPTHDVVAELAESRVCRQTGRVTVSVASILRVGWRSRSGHALKSLRTTGEFGKCGMSASARHRTDSVVFLASLRFSALSESLR